MKKIYSLLLAAAFIAAGCSAPKRIDGSSDEKMQQSMDAIRKSLSAEEQKKFNDALLTVGGNKLLGNLFSSKSDEEVQKEIRATLNGKTAAEIIAEAEKLRAENKKK